jgi:hypothetical protein
MLKEKPLSIVEAVEDELLSILEKNPLYFLPDEFDITLEDADFDCMKKQDIASKAAILFFSPSVMRINCCGVKMNIHRESSIIRPLETFH